MSEQLFLFSFSSTSPQASSSRIVSNRPISKISAGSNASTGVFRMRRPLKFLKRNGPRPTPISFSQIHSSVSSALTSKETRKTETHSNSPVIDCSPMISPCGTRYISDTKPYTPPTSRLLRSRNLNLTALDISACKAKTPKVEVLREDTDNHCEGRQTSATRPLTASKLARMSHFSDFSTNTAISTSRRLSSLITSTFHNSPQSSHTLNNETLPQNNSSNQNILISMPSHPAKKKNMISEQKSRTLVKRRSETYDPCSKNRVKLASTNFDFISLDLITNSHMSSSSSSTSSSTQVSSSNNIYIMDENLKSLFL